ncbi:hypothetical protein PR048_003324 [Dryococelus australis]|uniref:HAT C-terminal dimerisation domain-containing protein n=1 Tax=Dryococelus australis TaxID=614101 RepID=A0ABQ9INP4_9NEOP|nr:hypothetical protein PR048_003324 [Dryococelus australis]
MPVCRQFQKESMKLKAAVAIAKDADIELKRIRGQSEQEFEVVYKQAESMANSLGVEESVLAIFIEALKNCDYEIFPNIFKLLQILCTVPVSTSTAERRFSTLKRIKSYLEILHLNQY